MQNLLFLKNSCNIDLPKLKIVPPPLQKGNTCKDTDQNFRTVCRYMDIGLRQAWSISTTVLLELLKKRSQSVSAHKSRALFSNLRIGPATKSKTLGKAM